MHKQLVIGTSENTMGVFDKFKVIISSQLHVRNIAREIWCGGEKRYQRQEKLTNKRRTPLTNTL